MATLFEVLQFVDDNGVPLSAGHVYWYAAGTTTPKLTWKDAGETIPHSFPSGYVTLDGNGRPPGGAFFIRGSYKLVVKNADESIPYCTIDNINEYDSHDFTGLTASIADLNSTTTNTKVVGGIYTVALSDRGKTLLVDTLTADASINLPSAASVGNTFKVWIKKIDISTHSATIIPFAAQTIDGGTYYTLYDYNDFIEVRSDGSNWLLGGDYVAGTIVNLAITTTLALEDKGKIFNCNTTAGSFNINLPSAATVGKGFWVGFKKVDATTNQVGIIASGTELIDTVGTYYIGGAWQFLTIKSDGNNWFIIGSANNLQSWITSDVKMSYNNSQAGWVLLGTIDSLTSAGTIGNAVSGATVRANADTQALFIWLWDHISNTWCPLQDSAGTPVARGASGLADFNANRRMSLPRWGGRVPVSMGIAPNINVATIGSYFGDGTHVLTESELTTHAHTVPRGNDSCKADGNAADPGGILASSSATVTGYTGSSTPFSIIQPGTAVYFLMKL